MIPERLKELARRKGLTSSGNRDELVELLFNDMFEMTKNSNECLLEKCLTGWTGQDMRNYLGRLKQPIYGTKSVMAR